MTAVLTPLVFFNGQNGSEPVSGLIADAGGDLIGTTRAGGEYGDGTVFEIAKTSDSYASTPTLLVNFNDTDGSDPSSGLIADAAGDLFGTTYDGGGYINEFGQNENFGTVFELVSEGGGSYTFASLVTFYESTSYVSQGEGAMPWGGLVLDSAGDLFGTTTTAFGYYGSVFEIPKSSTSSTGYASTPVTWYNFNPQVGETPEGDLIVSGGSLFGTAYQGTTTDDGAVFEVSLSTGVFSYVSFDGADGANPVAGVIADAAGNLFGTTYGGGANGDGTVFELTKTGAGYAGPTPLFSFNNTDGANPWGGLIEDASGDLFGTTENGGANGDGTVFELTNDGEGIYTFNSLVNFDGGDGAHPFGSLMADANGDLFGTTGAGGPNGDGSVFEITGSGFIPAAQPVVTVAQFLAEQATLDAEPSGFIVSDTAADVAGAFDALNADSHIASIALTGGATPTLALSVTQTLNDTTALGEIVGPYTIAIVGTAANVNANLAAIITLIGEGRISSLTSTNITGQSYDETVESFDSLGNKTSLEYEGVTGEPYDAIQYFFSGTAATGYTKTGWDTYYSGQPSGLTEVDFNGSGQLTRELYSYASAGAGSLTGIELDYVAGQEADSLFTFAGPGGASYDRATYEFDSASSFVGATYQFTGQTYDEIQASFTPGTSPILTELTYGDYAGTGGPNEVSYFFDATGAPSAIQETFTGITGEAYTSDSVLYNASGTAVASEYSGYTTKPFSSLTYFDSASGATQEIVRDYTSDSSSGTVDGQAYSAHETIDNASNAPLGTAYQLDSGGNLYVGNASDVTSPTFGGTGVSPNAAELSYAITGGDWTITGGGTNESFSFASLFNTATITDYGQSVTAGKPDQITLAASDFANWQTFYGDGAASGVGGADTTFTSTVTGDKLTLDGVTLAQLNSMSADFKFV